MKGVGGRYYVVKEGALVKLLMLCDVIIATTYIIPLSFAAKYNKLAIVFNPLKYAITLEEGVSFLNDKKTLIKAIAAHFSEKQKYNSIVDIVKRMIG